MNDSSLMVPLHLKDTLRTLRIKYGYSQEEAAKLLGVTERTLRSWEKNSGNLSYQKIKKIERVYGVSQSRIFFGSEVSFSELFKRHNIS